MFRCVRCLLCDGLFVTCLFCAVLCSSGGWGCFICVFVLLFGGRFFCFCLCMCVCCVCFVVVGFVFVLFVLSSFVCVAGGGVIVCFRFVCVVVLC